ncbi:MAG: hypothetical protein ACR2QF_11435, partial [Geminicoccaceae bacterium]
MMNKADASWPSTRTHRLLAEVDLYLAANTDEEGIHARLYGLTFPHDHLLVAHGASWDKTKQSWAFGDRQSLERFVDALDKARDTGYAGLAEEPRIFNATDDLKSPLSRFLALGPNALENEDLLELLLSFDQYLADPSATSRRLFEEFGSLGAVLGCEPARLSRFDEITPRVRGLLKAVQLTIERVLHEPVQKNPVIGSWQALLDYLKGRL